MEFVTGSIETQWPSDQQNLGLEVYMKFENMKVLQDIFLHDCIVGMEYIAGSIENKWPSDQ